MTRPRECVAAILRVGTCFLVLAAATLPSAPPTRGAGPLDRIDHFIIIYQENWSFDALYGRFPGANGIANAGAAARQLDKNGRPYAVLPQPLDTRKTPHAPDPRFPATLPNGPFDLASFVLPTESTRPRARFLPGAVSDRWREDGQVCGVERCGRAHDELL